MLNSMLLYIQCKGQGLCCRSLHRTVLLMLFRAAHAMYKLISIYAKWYALHFNSMFSVRYTVLLPTALPQKLYLLFSNKY